MHQSLLKPLFRGGIWGPQCAVSETTAEISSKDGTRHSNCEREFSANTLALGARISECKRAQKISTLQLKYVGPPRRVHYGLHSDLQLASPSLVRAS